MLQNAGFRVRLRVRVGKGLTTDDERLTASFLGRQITIASGHKGGALRDADWLVLTANGFNTTGAAQEFGGVLRRALEMASLAVGLGVDTGDDRATSWVDEDFARSAGLLKSNERLGPNVHGITVLPDDDATRFISINGKGRVSADPTLLVNALEESGRSCDLSHVGNAIRLLNLALIVDEPLAKIVLAVSSVEELATGQKWSAAQKEIIKSIAATARNFDAGSTEERDEIARSIERSLFRVGLREGVARLLARHGMGDLRKAWNDLYDVRSALFHGSARMSSAEIGVAAGETVTLCVRIVLAVAARHGCAIPQAAASNYGIRVETAPAPRGQATKSDSTHD